MTSWQTACYSLTFASEVKGVTINIMKTMSVRSKFYGNLAIGFLDNVVLDHHVVRRENFELIVVLKV